MPLTEHSELVSEYVLRRWTGKPFVMVEGVTDRALWAEYADCDPIPTQGKDLIVDALKSYMLREAKGIAGIIDLDYELISQSFERELPNLLYDDCCPDMESILLRSPALKKILRNNLYNYEIDDVHQFAEKLISESQFLAAEFGYFRLLNHIKDYCIRFRDFDVTEVIDPDIPQLDRAKTAKRLAQQKAWISSEVLLQEVDELQAVYPPDNIQLCRGKDVVSIIAYLLPILFKAQFGEELPKDAKSAFQEKALSIRLRSAYDSGYFKRTSLFGCIRSWENTNSPYRILDPKL